MQNIQRQQEEIELAPFHREQWKAFFDRLDSNRDGHIRLKDFIAALENQGRGVPSNIIRGLRKRMEFADANQDKIITFNEFYAMVRSKEGPTYQRLLQKYIHYTVAARTKYDTTDDEYEDEYSCYPPKLGMTIITLIEICFFLYDQINDGSSTGPDGLWQMLYYSPARRKEAWRFVTYMFVHMGVSHLVVNLIVQILLGIPLEMVHGSVRVLVIYFAGVIAGSLGTSVSSPYVRLAGASGGVYALITAHIATIIMNWKEMRFAMYQMFIFASLITVDFGQALHAHYTGNTGNIGYFAHLCGAVTGLLVGINVLRNLRVRSWEVKVWWISLILFAALILSAVVVNVAFPSYFPKQEV